MMLHVDTARHKACAAAPEVLAVLGKLGDDHRGLPVPSEAGRGIGMK